MKLFVLMRLVSINGCRDMESIEAIRTTPEELVELWNSIIQKNRDAVSHLHKSYADKLPNMFENGELTCSQSYSGGGCYSVITHKIVEWKDKINLEN